MSQKIRAFQLLILAVSIFNRIATMILKLSSADPPLLIKGNGIPITGIIPKVIPMLMKK